MLNTFFKENERPTPETPYRQLELEPYGKEGWQVRLIAGQKAYREDAQVLETVSLKTFEEGLERHNEMQQTLQDEGWRLTAEPFRKFLESRDLTPGEAEIGRAHV